MSAAKNKPAPQDAGRAIEQAIEDSEALWELRVAAWQARWPHLSRKEIRERALASAIANSPWQPGSEPR